MSIRLPVPPSAAPTKQPGPFLTIKELAARWHISERQVHRFIAHGDLPVTRIGKRVLIAMGDILIFETVRRGVS